MFYSPDMSGNIGWAWASELNLKLFHGPVASEAAVRDQEDDRKHLLLGITTAFKTPLSRCAFPSLCLCKSVICGLKNFRIYGPRKGWWETRKHNPLQLTLKHLAHAVWNKWKKSTQNSKRERSGREGEGREGRAWKSRKEERAWGRGKGRKRKSRNQKFRPRFSSMQVMKDEDCNQKKK